MSIERFFKNDQKRFRDWKFIETSIYCKEVWNFNDNLMSLVSKFSASFSYRSNCNQESNAVGSKKKEEEESLIRQNGLMLHFMKQKWNVNIHPVGTENELISSSCLCPMESVIVKVQWKNKV